MTFYSAGQGNYRLGMLSLYRQHIILLAHNLTEWMDGRRDGRIDVWKDGRTDGRMDGEWIEYIGDIVRYC